MQKVIDQYKSAYSLHGYSLQSLLCLKDRRELVFGALTKPLKALPCTVLDFGCGLAHLKGYLDKHLPQCTYTGADFVHEFIEENKARYPDQVFLQIQSPEEITETYDYVLLSGVFNLLYNNDPVWQQRYIFDSLSTLFRKTRKALCVNFMTDQVDFVQSGAYHQNPAELYHFVTQNLTRRVVLDQSYMPYEYTLTLYKEQSIDHPNSTYHL